jgi:hypothetical protein
MDGEQGRAVLLWTEGWSGMVRRIGDKPEYGDACEFAPLGKGLYFVQPEGLEQRAEVHVPGNRIMWVTFTPKESDAATSPPPPAPPAKDLPLYILIRTKPADLAGFLDVMRFAARVDAPMGPELKDALRAEKVIVLAAEEDFSQEEADQLRQAGVEFIRIPPEEYATALDAWSP